MAAILIRSSANVQRSHDVLLTVNSCYVQRGIGVRNFLNQKVTFKVLKGIGNGGIR